MGCSGQKNEGKALVTPSKKYRPWGMGEGLRVINRSSGSWWSFFCASGTECCSVGNPQKGGEFVRGVLMVLQWKGEAFAGYCRWYERSSTLLLCRNTGFAGLRWPNWWSGVGFSDKRLFRCFSAKEGDLLREREREKSNIEKFFLLSLLL